MANFPRLGRFGLADFTFSRPLLGCSGMSGREGAAGLVCVCVADAAASRVSNSGAVLG